MLAPGFLYDIIIYIYILVPTCLYDLIFLDFFNIWYKMVSLYNVISCGNVQNCVWAKKWKNWSWVAFRCSCYPLLFLEVKSCWELGLLLLLLFGNTSSS